VITLTTSISNEMYDQLVQGKNIESDVYLVDDVLQDAKDVVSQTQNEITMKFVVQCAKYYLNYIPFIILNSKINHTL
jgi:hypothetical protein